MEHRPADLCGSRCARDLWQCRASNRLEYNCIRTLCRGGLDGPQNLRALIDGVVVRVKNLRRDAQLARGLLRRLRLLNLIVVVVGSQRNKNSYLRHPCDSHSWRHTIHRLALRQIEIVISAAISTLSRSVIFEDEERSTVGSPDGSRTRNLHLERVTS